MSSDNQRPSSMPLAHKHLGQKKKQHNINEKSQPFLFQNLGLVFAMPTERNGTLSPSLSCYSIDLFQPVASLLFSISKN